MGRDGIPSARGCSTHPSIQAHVYVYQICGNAMKIEELPKDGRGADNTTVGA